jgi:polygalacturonase
MKHSICLLLTLFLLFSHISQGSSLGSGYNVLDYGAKADGINSDTEAIQKAIDDCHLNGGGKVVFNTGTFISGTIILKSNVTLYIEAGAILKASNNLDDFPIMSSRYPSYEGKFETNKMLIYAEDAKNISITGRGTIDGNGDHWIDGPYGSPSFSIRPRIIHFRGCEDIHISDITLYNSASWVQSYQSCKNMVIDGITVNSRENKDIEKDRYADARGRNTDGLDLVDCENVRISNCYINSGDDAICLKSFSPDEGCRDITIINCIISSNASGIKIGTETAGTFEDITIQNCIVFDTRAEAIAILSADGARVERINISNISLRNIKGAAIAIRLGNRNRLYRKNIEPNEQPIIQDVILENIQGTCISADFGCSVTGIKDFPVKNIVLKNINLQFVGGGTADDSYREIPENETGYPSGRMFGRIPAYGFFIRHAKNVTLSNVFLRFDKEDHRPAVLCDEVDQLEIKGLRASGTMNSPELIRLVNTQGVIISESKPTTPVPVFLSVNGESGEIILLNNFLKNAVQNVVSDSEANRATVTESGTIE